MSELAGAARPTRSAPRSADCTENIFEILPEGTFKSIEHFQHSGRTTTTAAFGTDDFTPQSAMVFIFLLSPLCWYLRVGVNKEQSNRLAIPFNDFYRRVPRLATPDPFS